MLNNNIPFKLEAITSETRLGCWKSNPQYTEDVVHSLTPFRELRPRYQPNDL